MKIAGCYETKYGTIHKSEEAAKNAEFEENVDDFIEKMKIALHLSEGSYYQTDTLFKKIYYYRKDVLELLQNFEFTDKNEIEKC